MKITLLGAAGGIGQALALLLTTRLPQDGELSLYDIAPVTAGIAVDLSHIPSPVRVRGFCGPDASPALLGADIVLIVAASPASPVWIARICLMLMPASCGSWSAR